MEVMTQKNKKKVFHCIVLYYVCVWVLLMLILPLFFIGFFANDEVEWRGNRLKYKKTRKLLSIEPNNVKYFIF